MAPDANGTLRVTFAKVQGYAPRDGVVYTPQTTLSGVLAAVVATPCTAPFMGAAVGYTLTQDTAHALAVFLALGVVIALPVLALSVFPRMLRLLPRPGAWLDVCKQILAFPLCATVVWLAWVLGA